MHASAGYMRGRAWLLRGFTLLPEAFIGPGMADGLRRKSGAVKFDDYEVPP